MSCSNAHALLRSLFADHGQADSLVPVIVIHLVARLVLVSGIEGNEPGGFRGLYGVIHRFPLRFGLIQKVFIPFGEFIRLFHFLRPGPLHAVSAVIEKLLCKLLRVYLFCFFSHHCTLPFSVKFS